MYAAALSLSAATTAGTTGIPYFQLGQLTSAVPIQWFGLIVAVGVLIGAAILRRYAEHAAITIPELTPAVQQLLIRYAWPGNVRELRNAVERAAILAEGGPIEPHHIPLGAPMMATPPLGVPVPRQDPSTALTQPGRQPDRDAIVRALVTAGGNQHKAAELLGVHRRTLMRWMDLLKITRPRKSG